MFSATLPDYCADQDFIDMLCELKQVTANRSIACLGQQCSLLHCIVEHIQVHDMDIIASCVLSRDFLHSMVKALCAASWSSLQELCRMSNLIRDGS